MSLDRARVRELVREELSKRLTAPASTARHPALLVVELPDDDPIPPDAEAPVRPCVIEPDRPCYQSGYCKRLGY